MQLTGNLNLNIVNARNNKNALIENFLQNIKIKCIKIEPLKADCSLRRYYRIYTPETSYILMDASRDQSSIEPFITNDNFLIQNKFSAPKIYHQDLENGFLLIEDFGKYTFTIYLQTFPNKELSLYKHAVTNLIILHKTKPTIDLSDYDQALMDRELNKFVEYFLKYKVSKKIFDKASHEFFEIFHALYINLNSLKKVVCLRDYMADNLMHLNERINFNKVGILDFQDAVYGNPAYDLVSLLEDARRDINEETVKHCYDQYIATLAAIDKDKFELSYQILSLQRNLKIVGIFNARNILDNEPSYLLYLPRVWKFVENSLNQPEMLTLKNWFIRYEIELKA